MLALIILADGTQPIAYETIPEGTGDAEWLREKVEGPIGLVRLTEGRAMWVNDEHKTNGMPVNVAATGLALLIGGIESPDYICGPAVILGAEGPDSVGLTKEQFVRTYSELTTSVLEMIRNR